MDEPTCDEEPAEGSTNPIFYELVCGTNGLYKPSQIKLAGQTASSKPRYQPNCFSSTAAILQWCNPSSQHVLCFFWLFFNADVLLIVYLRKHVSPMNFLFTNFAKVLEARARWHLTRFSAHRDMFRLQNQMDSTFFHEQMHKCLEFLQCDNVSWDTSITVHTQTKYFTLIIKCGAPLQLIFHIYGVSNTPERWRKIEITQMADVCLTLWRWSYSGRSLWTFFSAFVFSHL